MWDTLNSGLHLKIQHWWLTYQPMDITESRDAIASKNLSRTHFYCQVPSCKLTLRGDNFTSHNLSKVKFDDNGQPVNPKSVRIWF